MEKIDKVKAMSLLPMNFMAERPDMYLAQVMYDVSMLHRVSHSELTEILFEKTIKLYPFAVVDKCIQYLSAKRKTALIYIQIPLSSAVRISTDIKKDITHEEV